MRHLKRLALAAASAVVLLGILESLALLRIVDYRIVLATPIREPWSHPGNLLDPVLLHVHRPHDRFRWHGVDYRYDHRGLRNETDLETADVVVVGDSFIEGTGVAAAELVTAHLARALGRPVANLGQSWYAPQQELELLRRHGPALRPRVCLWAFFEGNDLADLARYERAVADWPRFSRRLHSFGTRSFTANALRALERMHAGGPAADDVNSRTHGDVSGLFDLASGRRARLYFWYPGRELGEEDALALDRLTAVLARADALCGEQGIRFAVVFVPTKFRVHGELTHFEPGAKPLEWVRNDLPRRLEALVQERLAGTGFVDLTPALAAEAARGTLVYQTKDSHWTRHGHRVAAEALASFLRERLDDE